MPAMQALRQKADHSQQGASRSGKPTQGAGSSAVLAYHRRELAVLENLWKESAVLAYHRRELAVLENLWMESAVLAYHRRELAVLANLWRKVI
jgi:hypothetical protein